MALSRIQSFIQQHRLQPGSRVVLHLQDGASIKGQLLPLSFENQTESLILAEERGDCFAVPLDLIQHIRETGFGPWPGQEPTPSSTPLSRVSSHLQKSSGQKSSEMAAESRLPGREDLSHPSHLSHVRTPKRDRPLFVLETSQETGVGTEVRVVSPTLASEIVVLHEQDRIPASFHASGLLQATLSSGHLVREFFSSSLHNTSGTGDMMPWQRLYHAIEQALQREPAGIVVTYAQEDVLWAATALSWMLRELPIPVVWVGIGRSERFRVEYTTQDVENACMMAAFADQAEMMIAMPESAHAQRYVLLRPTQTISVHSTHRSGWASLSATPLACFCEGHYRLLRHDSPPRLLSRRCVKEPGWMSQVYHIPFSSWDGPDLCVALSHIPVRGVVLSGGRDELPPASWKSGLLALLDRGVPVYLTSRAWYGSAHLYQTREGRVWQDMGLLSLPSILPEVAQSKLSWATCLASTREQIYQRMITPMAGEFGEFLGGSVRPER